VDDQSTASGSNLLYNQAISDANIALGNTNGWSLQVILRVPSSDVTDDGSVVVSYRDGGAGWQMNFGHDALGNTVVKLFTNVVGSIDGPTLTVAGNSTYNTFELVYDPVATSADLFVNGSEEISDYAGLPGSQVGNTKQVIWGAGRSGIAGEGRYNEVSLHLLPEPSAALLLLAGALVLWRPTRR
jgi:hypothetical protein